MLIWKGHGILILVFGILGGLLAGFATASIFAATNWEWAHRMVVPSNLWGAAIAIWLYGRTLGKTIVKTYVDPATRMPVNIKSSHTLFFIPATPWAVLAAVLACLTTMGAFNEPAEAFMSDSQLAVAAPGKAAFKEANRLIDSDKGKTAHGNTPDAEKLAAVFSELVMKGREMGVEKGKKPTISLTHGKFLTYCRINPDSCVFMVHVPSLRNFSDEAKTFMVGMAWTMAREVAANLRPMPSKLVVGVRGAFLYDEVVEGPAAISATEGNEDWQAGIALRSKGSDGTDRLALYFEPHAPDVVLAKLPTEVPHASPSGSVPDSKPMVSNPRTFDDLKTAPSPEEKVEVLLDWFPTLKPGSVAGNADAANQMALKYAGFVHDQLSSHPALGGLSLPDPCFSAYVHLRDDSATFVIALPAGTELSPGAIEVGQEYAWRLAAMISSQVSPIPARVAVVFFNEGRMELTRVGSPQNQEGTQWLVEYEMTGTRGKEMLTPFLAAPSRPLITLKSPIELNRAVTSMLATDRRERTAPAAKPVPPSTPPLAGAATAPVPPATAPAVMTTPPALLPTAVRDWKDATGRVMQASLQSFANDAKDTGRFKRADGQVFEVPFSRLSADDQAFIRELARQSKAAP